MAKSKKRSMRQSDSSSSSAASRRGRGKEAAWKRSKSLAIVLGCVIFIIWIRMIAGCLFGGGDGGSGGGLKDFPYTYMTEKTFQLRVIKSDKPQKVPLEDPEGSGELLWEAYECNNPECPFMVEKGKPYVFPYVIPERKNPPAQQPQGPDGMPMPDDYMFTPPFCPLCKEVGKEAYNVTRHLTEEGKQKLEEYRQQLMKKK